jgi:hypothetical protein
LKCGEQPQFTGSMLDLPTGRTFHMFEFKCGIELGFLRRCKATQLAASSFALATVHASQRGLTPTCQMIFDVIGDLITNERQRKQLVLNDRLSVCSARPRKGRLAPHAVRPIIHAEHGTV